MTEAQLIALYWKSGSRWSAFEAEFRSRGLRVPAKPRQPRLPRLERAQARLDLLEALIERDEMEMEERR